jgi:putative IMPACT (imprinted ancient) family translation regulator
MIYGIRIILRNYVNANISIEKEAHQCSCSACLFVSNVMNTSNKLKILYKNRDRVSAVYHSLNSDLFTSHFTHNVAFECGPVSEDGEHCISMSEI